METKRIRRTPVDGARDILAVYDQDPNYVYRWVADDPQRPGRVQRLQERGYEVVQQDVQVGQKAVDKLTKTGSAVTRTGGGGITLVLMRIPKEWFEEDQKAKQDHVDALEAAMQADIRQGRIPGSNQPAASGGSLSIQHKMHGKG